MIAGKKSGMAHLESKGHLKSGTVHWTVERHRLEFTEEEFRNMISGIQRQGLFAYLEYERPALKSQLLDIGRGIARIQGLEEDQVESELEFLFEQALINLSRVL